MAFAVVQLDDPAAVLDAAREHLVARPVEHNLVLTLLHQRVARPEPGRYWLVRDGSEVVGVGFQSPIDFAVTATPMSSEAAEALTTAIASAGGTVPGVQAEASTAARIAGVWTEVMGTAAVPLMGMRIYAMEALAAPDLAGGVLRACTPDDTELVLEWVDGFHRDTGQASVIPSEEQSRRVAAGVYRLWCVDGEPVSMCARTPALDGAARVNAVYTPPGLRGRGYAAAGVAALSAEILAEGSTPMLFTDLGNPTSNRVYRRIGYRAVAENLRYEFS